MEEVSICIFVVYFLPCIIQIPTRFNARTHTHKHTHTSRTPYTHSTHTTHTHRTHTHTHTHIHHTHTSRTPTHTTHTHTPTHTTPHTHTPYTHTHTHTRIFETCCNFVESTAINTSVYKKYCIKHHIVVKQCCTTEVHHSQHKYLLLLLTDKMAGPSGPAVYDVGLLPLACLDCGFESHRGGGGVLMSVCCECWVLSGRGLCDELITRPEESYRLWCLVVCDLGIL